MAANALARAAAAAASRRRVTTMSPQQQRLITLSAARIYASAQALQGRDSSSSSTKSSGGSNLELHASGASKPFPGNATWHRTRRRRNLDAEAEACNPTQSVLSPQSRHDAIRHACTPLSAPKYADNRRDTLLTAKAPRSPRAGMSYTTQADTQGIKDHRAPDPPPTKRAPRGMLDETAERIDDLKKRQMLKAPESTSLSDSQKRKAKPKHERGKADGIESLKPSAAPSGKSYAVSIFAAAEESATQYNRFKSNTPPRGRRHSSSRSLRRARFFMEKFRDFRAFRFKGAFGHLVSFRKEAGARALEFLDQITDKPSREFEAEAACLRIEATAYVSGQESALELLEALEKNMATEIEQDVRMGPPSDVDGKHENGRIRHYIYPALQALCESTLQAGASQESVERLLRAILLSSKLSSLVFEAPKATIPRVYVVCGQLQHHEHLARQIADAARNLAADESGTAMSILILGLANSGRIFEASRMYHWAHRQGLRFREMVSRRLLRIISFEKEDELAEEIIKLLIDQASSSGQPVLQRVTYKALAEHFALQGNAPRMEEQLQNIDKHYSQVMTNGANEVQARDLRALHASVVGDVAQCIELLREDYNLDILEDQEPDQGSKRNRRPSFTPMEKYVQIADAFVHADMMDMTELLIERLSKRYKRLPTRLFESLLNGYANRGDLASAVSLFEEMNRREPSITLATVNAMVKVFAHSKDVESATKLVESLPERNLEVNRQVLCTLLDAHVTVGSWRSAMDLFAQMLNHQDPRLRPGPKEYNVMLHAFVKRPLPIQQTFDFLKHMLRAGFKPTPHTFTILLISALDADRVPLAEEIFSLAETHLGGMYGRPAGQGANSFHFTVMIQAYLLRNDLTTAREYLQELTRRKEPIDGILRGILINSFSQTQGGKEGLVAAQELARSFVKDSPLSSFEIYRPLMARASRLFDSDAAEALIRDVIDSGVDVPIDMWTSLLDNLRRNGNSEAALQVWQMIFDKALDHERTIRSLSTQSSDVDADSKGGMLGFKGQLTATSSRRNILCVPLSITIDVLTHDARHDEIAKIWLQCRRQGFGFDSHNWNHLAVALLHAGRIEEACNILEKVLVAKPPERHMMKGVQEQVKREMEIRERAANARKIDEGTSDTSDPPPETQPGKFSYPPFAGEVETLFGDDIQDRAQTGRLTKRSKRHFSDGRVDLPVELNSRSSARMSPAQADRYEPVLDDKNLLRSMRMRQMVDRETSPWFPHFETLRMLSEIVRDARENGMVLRLRAPGLGDPAAQEDVIQSPDTLRHSSRNGQDLKERDESQDPASFIPLSTFLQQHPRVATLLDDFERKAEAMPYDQMTVGASKPSARI